MINLSFSDLKKSNNSHRFSLSAIVDSTVIYCWLDEIGQKKFNFAEINALITCLLNKSCSCSSQGYRKLIQGITEHAIMELDMLNKALFRRHWVHNAWAGALRDVNLHSHSFLDKHKIFTRASQNVYLYHNLIFQLLSRLSRMCLANPSVVADWQKYLKTLNKHAKNIFLLCDYK